ncbi:MAG: hypothetical protein K6347_04540 [Campylobacterales bacterium]
MINYANWIEYDYNPFILFDSNGDILSLNQSAQFLISKVTPKTLYEMAVAYAPKSFGYKTSFVDLTYDVFYFFAITVGYDNDEEIGIKLYQSPYGHAKKSVTLKELEPVNIYLLIDACMANLASRHAINFKKEIDPTLPMIKLPQTKFLKLLSKAYEAFSPSDEILTQLKIKTGEFLQISGQKCQILQLKLSANKRLADHDLAIEQLGHESNIFASFDDQAITLNIPVIL